MRDPAAPSGRPITAVEVDLHDLLAVAHVAAAALADWHEAKGAHGRLGPHAILSTVSGGIELVAPELAAGPAAPFVAPEQRGPARRVDERSDLYALGAVIRELHRPRLPVLPPVLEEIVLRLLAEQPEDRYRTARGLAADLDHCLTAMDDVGRIAAFPLGRWDAGDRLVVSERLYGRQQRLGRLHAMFDQVTTDGRSRLVCITGERGIGKSALAAALAGPVVESGGRMLFGGFDRYRSGAPYTGFVRAVAAGLGSMEVPAAWGVPLGEALGPVADGVAELLPALRSALDPVTGSLRPVSGTQMLPLAADRRLRIGMSRLIGHIAQPRAPVVLLLDDLQWADADSLRLLADLVLDPTVRHVLVIGTYRPQDVRADHPLLAVHAQLTAQRRLAIMTLRPLPDAALTELLADTLRGSAGRIAPLAHMVAGKTGANPLFIGQFLHWLRERDLLRYAPDGQQWTWDLDAVRNATLPATLAALVAERLGALPPPVRRLLHTAALLSDDFDAELLSTVVGRPLDEVADSARSAVSEHLLVREPAGVLAFRWRNEALRHSALSLVPERELPAKHRQIAAALAKGGEPEGESLFAVVTHLDAGGVRSTSTAERLHVVRLNRAAGRQANRVGAINAARAYLAYGVKAMPAAAWSAQYQLALDLYTEAARAESRVGQAARARQLLDTAMAKARNDLDRARLLRLQIRLADPPGRWEAAAEPGLRALRLLGYELPIDPAGCAVAAERASAAVRERLATDRPHEGRPMTDARALLAADLIADLLPIVRDETDWHALLAATGVQLSLDHGETGAAGVAFAHYGAYVLGAGPGDRPFVATCLQTALRMATELPATEHRASALLPIASALPTWYGPPEVPLDLFRQAYRAGIEQDDALPAIAGRVAYCQHLLAAGVPLDRLAEEIHDLRAVLRRLGMAADSALAHEVDIVEATVDRLRGSTVEPAAPRSGAVLPGQIMAAYLFGEYVEALRLCRTHASRTLRAESTFLTSERYFYQALSLAALHDSASPAQQRAWAAKLDRLHGPLDEWAARGPATFGHKALLVSAERARLAGDTAYAMGRLDRAIGQAREFGFAHIEAIAAEVAGRYASERGDRIEAVAYLKRAQSCYARWGARSKADAVGRVLAELGPPEAPASLVDRLDLIAVLKAGRAIAGELELDKILATLLELLVQHAGAERGSLLLPERRGWRVAAAAESEDAGIAVTHTPAGPLDQHVPAAVVRYVHRTRELVTGGVTNRTFASDPYLKRHRPASLLCAPIVRRDRLVAILYLEHRALTAAFTAEHLDVLEVLCAQAAVSLENADIYARMSETDRLLEATVKDLPVGLVVFNTDLTVRSASTRAQQLCGVPLPPGAPLAAVSEALHIASWDLQALATTVVTPPAKPRLFRVAVRLPSSQQSRLSVGMRPLLDDSGAVIGISMSLVAG